MRSLVPYLAGSLQQLFFPHVCRNCFREIRKKEQFLCIHCLSELPFTRFATMPGNPVEKIFYGRVHITAATSTLFFTTSSIVQHLIHQIKYKGQQELAVYLGRMMGLELAASGRYSNIDFIVPLPLFKTRQRERGYNQSSLLARGISEVTGLPVKEKLITRARASATQTKRSRAERWMNVEGLFRLWPGALTPGQNILLVDDVITTGATLEACAQALLSVKDTRVSISALAYAMK